VPATRTQLVVDGLPIRSSIRVSADSATATPATCQDSADAIGTGLYNLFQLLNPEVFIIGGGLINLGYPYLERIEKRYLSLVKNMMYDKVDFKLPSHGNDTGLLGAAALILEENNE